MEQLVLLLIIATISFINWLLQRSAELREKRKAQRESSPQVFESTPPPIPQNKKAQSPPFSEPEPEPDPEEAMRRLMEALGIPLEQEPPPLPQPQPSAPPPPAEPPPPQVQPTFTREPLPSLTPTLHTLAESPTTTNFESFLPQTQATPSQDWSQALREKRLADQAAIAQLSTKKKNRFKDLLLSPSSFQDAIVLSEVLGKPLALRDPLSLPGDPPA